MIDELVDDVFTVTMTFKVPLDLLNPNLSDKEIVKSMKESLEDEWGEVGLEAKIEKYHRHYA